MRILLVTYYFPPFNSVGAVRPGKFARWLHGQGHDVHVLTCSNQPFPQGLPLEIPLKQVTAVPAWSVNAPVEWLRGGGDKVARQGFGATAGGGTVLGRLGRFYKNFLHWPDGQLGWVGSARSAGRDLLRQRQFDLVYATAPPFSVFRVAAELASMARIPWVAEFRDLWTDNHAYDAPAWRRAIERGWESRLLRAASALVTVSPPLAQKLRRFGLPVWEVRNGCDPEDFDGLACPADFSIDPDSLQIAFTGNVYEPHYDVDAFCAGLALHVGQRGRAQVHVAGRNTSALLASAQRHGVVDFFRFKSVVPRAQALAMQKHADVLLAFLWGGEGGQGVYSAKLFEYAGAGRPILAVGRLNDVGQLVANSGMGRACTSAKEVAQFLAEAHDRKVAGNQISFAKEMHFDFSRKSQFTKLEKYLMSLLADVSTETVVPPRSRK